MNGAGAEIRAPETTRVPHIFFSYARPDRMGGYLEKFFEDLSERTAQALGLGEAKIAFVDTQSVQTGEDWNTRIATALQVSKVLVCIYSPNFFSKERAHEYCAKEFDAFLRRHPDLRYERVVDGGQSRFRIRDARNIVPILWLAELDLEPQDLPPFVVRTITYSLNQIDRSFGDRVSETYRSKGMEHYARRRNPTYAEIVASLARLIRDYAQRPLPVLPNPPEFSALRNAFWDPPPDAGVEPAAAQSAPTIEQRVKDNPGPRQVLAIELRLTGAQDTPWVPFAGDQPVASLVGEIATSRRLVRTSAVIDPTLPGFPDEFIPTLQTATANTTSVLLLVHPECLDHGRARTALESLLSNKEWRGGVLVPADAADRPSARAITRNPTFFQLSLEQQERIAIRSVVGSLREFRAAVIALFDEIAARIVKLGEVQRESPDNSGPERRPMIANTASGAVSK